MGVLHVTTFFWCMSLEMGSKCIGILHLAVSVALLVLCSLSAEGARGYMGTAEDLGDQVYTTWFNMSLTAAVFTVAHVVLALTLLRRKTVGLRVWVWVMSLLWAVALAGAVVLAALRGIDGSGPDIFLAIIGGLTFFWTLAYCILCVNSYFLLRSAEDNRGPGQAKNDYY